MNNILNRQAGQPGSPPDIIICEKAGKNSCRRLDLIAAAVKRAA